MSTFTVSYPTMFYAMDIGVIAVFVAIGAYLAFGRSRHKRTVQPDRVEKVIKRAVVAGVAVSLLVFLYAGGAFSPSPSITIKGDQIVLSASPYLTRTVDAGMVREAYITNIDNGNISLSTPWGANWGTASLGNFMLGKFTMSNGAPAYVVTGQSENVVMRLSDGSYLVMGPSDFSGFVSALQTTFLNRTIPTQA